VVLAAGIGTRMKSDLPKVLHRLDGKPILLHVLEALAAAGLEDVILVLGYGREEIVRELRKTPGRVFRVAVQEKQLGTGHALRQAETLIAAATTVLVVAGDTPLLDPDTLSALILDHEREGRSATLLSAVADDPFGYGRIVRNAAGGLAQVVEQKETTPDTADIREINTGVYCFHSDQLFPALRALKNHNRQGEYYLPEVCALLQMQGEGVGIFSTDDFLSIQGVNDRVQLAAAEQTLRRRVLKRWMLAGVTLIDPDTTYIGAEVVIGVDTVICPMTILSGRTVIGAGCVIGPGTELRDTRVGQRSEIRQSVVIEADIGDDCTVGPFAHLRPQTALAEQVKAGAFVEIKQSHIGRGSKVPHLSYVGDAEVGAEVNVGAGTITCNYDGRHKYRTVIGDHAFIGSNSNLIAPISIGAGAVTGAGSSLSEDVAANMLAVERGTIHVKPLNFKEEKN
jgi:bifunctional UDP-N-acetylglucosamine pyrophosphorylase/glucosamine-1-phosphate N-acetyltransferase